MRNCANPAPLEIAQWRLSAGQFGQELIQGDACHSAARPLTHNAGSGEGTMS